MTTTLNKRWQQHVVTALFFLLWGIDAGVTEGFFQQSFGRKLPLVWQILTSCGIFTLWGIVTGLALVTLGKLCSDRRFVADHGVIYAFLVVVAYCGSYTIIGIAFGWGFVPFIVSAVLRLVLTAVALLICAVVFSRLRRSLIGEPPPKWHGELKGRIVNIGFLEKRFVQELHAAYLAASQGEAIPPGFEEAARILFANIRSAIASEESRAGEPTLLSLALGVPLNGQEELTSLMKQMRRPL